ncbi:hypothetical protein AB0C07_05460 [Actinoplanes missouriensis]|uniref:hypothetical protein n=1 Tax=Actinoplanes missouriensis TaxID=1866 RepID=UPI0033E66D2B
MDGVTYRWRVRKRPSRPAPLSFAVEQAGRRGAVLLATMPDSTPADWIGPPSTPVVPSIVAEVVRRGREHGWRPEQTGPAFPITVGRDIWATR